MSFSTALYFRRFHRVCCARASHSTGCKIPKASLGQALGLNESKSQEAMAVTGHRKRSTVAPKSFAISKIFATGRFCYMKFSAGCGKQPCSLFERREPPSFLPVVADVILGGRKEGGNSLLIPDVDIVCSALCTGLNALTC